MALGSNTLQEHRLLLQALMQLEHESIARKLKNVMLLSISVQQDAVKQAQLKLSEHVDKSTKQNIENLPMSIPTNLDSLNETPDTSWQWEILRAVIPAREP
jgi:hypothetical protein